MASLGFYFSNRLSDKWTWRSSEWRGPRSYLVENRLSILNQPIMSTILREIVSPYLSRSSPKVSSRNVPIFDNSSVVLHTRTYSGLIPDTGSSVAAASISAGEPRS